MQGCVFDCVVWFGIPGVVDVTMLQLFVYSIFMVIVALPLWFRHVYVMCVVCVFVFRYSLLCVRSCVISCLCSVLCVFCVVLLEVGVVCPVG